MVQFSFAEHCAGVRAAIGQDVDLPVDLEDGDRSDLVGVDPGDEPEPACDVGLIHQREQPMLVAGFEQRAQATAEGASVDHEVCPCALRSDPSLTVRKGEVSGHQRARPRLMHVRYCRQGFGRPEIDDHNDGIGGSRPIAPLQAQLGAQTGEPARYQRVGAEMDGVPGHLRIPEPFR